MKNEKNIKALKIYEDTMRKAADVRREAFGKVETQYQTTKKEAHEKYLRDSKKE